ncbi:hypothetical protein [Pelagicoccus sp. SDUM812005]|uniref:hypothetical protein n=1 Tax=Pelagicoccus sp. SDUM812005 TaxID=3041257 RepID=UPI00280E29C2|nr:hypothetical protein [Pelagicoccus sp. SDUM812005]MDQ8181225.1 hypothetical protein [Pelagicoccus sp. SDUM812005]
MDPREKKQQLFREDQRQIQRQYQLAVEQRAKLEALKRRQQELSASDERLAHNFQLPRNEHRHAS